VAVTKHFYVYAINPIDVYWRCLPRLDDVLWLLESKEARDGFMDDYYHALSKAIDAGWEEDFTEKPRAFFLPDDTAFSYGFVWKQSNSGTTFVVTPHEMPWLDSLAHRIVR
jgi:hypothetical protein